MRRRVVIAFDPEAAQEHAEQVLWLSRELLWSPDDEERAVIRAVLEHLKVKLYNDSDDAT